MYKMLFRGLISSLTLFCYIKGIQIQECKNGDVEAVENTISPVTCADYTDLVTWRYILPIADSAMTQIGTCGATCTVDPAFPPTFGTLTWLSASSSRLNLSTTVTARRYANTTFFCGLKQCNLAIIVNAVLGALTVNLSNTDNGWTVTGTVGITKVFSSNEQYRCVWSRRHGGGQYTAVTTKTLFPEPNPNNEDKSGTCDFTDRPPDTTGNYTYRVQVYPGATEKTDSSVGITSPPVPSIICTPITGYVSEDTDVSCTCNGSVGRPAGRLVWVRRNNNVDTTVKEGSYGQVSLQLTMTVNRSHDGNKLRCDVDWVTDTTGPAYTVNVTYGPDSANIPEGPEFYTDSTGSHSLTLTCNPRDAKPTSDLTYQWTGPCASVTSKSCSFMPHPPADNGITVQCDITNPNNEKRVHASYTLQLKYPPSDAPNIQGYTNNHILYQGDPLNINCAVVGGEPRVTSVTLTCTGHSPDTSTGQRSSLNVTSLSAGDHGAVCTCSARWAKPKYYTLTATRTLTVYYPPSEPSITDTMTKPYLEGDNVTLTCSLTSSGHPTANIIWSGQENGVINNPDRNTSTLGLSSVGKVDNLRNITCQAVNNFTREKQRDLSEVKTLRVYYGPYIAVNSNAGNTCTMTSNSLTCTAVEGQRVHFRSKADSHPPPQRYVWQALNGSALDLASGGDLDIVSINRSQSGVYRVQVTTTKPDVTDSRLPLTSHRDLTVLVKYTASDITFNVDNNKNLTINESELVTFDCQSRGRPTPELQLTQSDTVLQRAYGGDLGLSEVSTRLAHNITAQCNNTGLYMCSAHNGVGDTQRDTAQLYVNCKPRSNPTSSAEPLDVNYVGKPVLVGFGLVAYPVPDDNSFAFRVNESDTNIPGSIQLNVTCFTKDTDYDVTCNVSISDVADKKAEGLYILRAANAFGKEEFLFNVIVNGTMDSAEEQTRKLNITAVAGGIGAALVVIAIVAVAFFIVRRQRKDAKTSQSNLTRLHCVQEREDPDMTVNELYGTSPRGATQDADFANQTRKEQGNAYEDVELNSSTNGAGKCVSVPGSSRAQAKTSAHKDQSTVKARSSDDASTLYATVNKGTKPSFGAHDRPGPASGGKQKPDVKPKPAKKSKPGNLKHKPTGKKMEKQDDKQLLQTGEYGNVGMTSLTMSPHSQEGSVYENYAFEKEESRNSP